MMIIMQTLSKKKLLLHNQPNPSQRKLHSKQTLRMTNCQMHYQRKQVLLQHPFYCHNCYSKPQKCLLVPLHFLTCLILRKISGQLPLSINSNSTHNFITVVGQGWFCKTCVSFSGISMEYHTLPKLVHLMTTNCEERLVIWNLSVTRKLSETKKVKTLLLANAQMFGKCSVKLV